MGKKFTPVAAAPAKGTNGRPDFTRFHVSTFTGEALGTALKLNTGGWVAIVAGTTDPVYSGDNTLEAAVEYLSNLI